MHAEQSTANEESPPQFRRSLPRARVVWLGCVASGGHIGLCRCSALVHLPGNVCNRGIRLFKPNFLGLVRLQHLADCAGSIRPP